MNFDGSLIWMASVCGYVHLMQSPMYFSSKAALISMAKSLSPLRKMFGIRNAAVCPGPVKASSSHSQSFLNFSAKKKHANILLLHRPPSSTPTIARAKCYPPSRSSPFFSHFDPFYPEFH